MKKILYIGNQLASRGATVTSIETLGSFLKAEGFSVKTASRKKNHVLRLLDMAKAVFKNRENLDYILIDTYSTKNFWYAFIVAKLCKRFSLKYIPILRGGNLPNRLKKSVWASNFIFKNAYINVAPSAYLFSEFQKANYTNLEFIPNTIEIANYSFFLRKEIRPKLLWVRAFSEIYNPILALKVLERLLKSFPNAELCMVGPVKDKSFAACKNYTEAHNLPVTFTGKLEKDEWISLSTEYDIFLNTTNFDNTPVSVMEAMALGLPVISTDVGGMPYLIDNKIDGVLVPPNNVDAFVSEIENLLHNPTQAHQIAIAARKKAESFDWEAVKAKWLLILS